MHPQEKSSFISMGKRKKSSRKPALVRQKATLGEFFFGECTSLLISGKKPVLPVYSVIMKNLSLCAWIERKVWQT